MVSLYFERDWKEFKNRINLGLCCINTQLREQKVPIFCSRTMIRKNFTVDKAKELALKNVQDISKLIQWNEEHNIKCLRLSSDLFPHFTDKETEKYTIDFAREELKRAGDLAKKLGHRILMHPGQYNQVGAQSRDVFEQTVKDLEHHANILDAMGIDENGVLIVHGGGTYGDKKKSIERWIHQFSDLPQCVKNRLVIENCERQYSIDDCLEISQEIGIPVVLDFHHYDCYNTIYPENKQRMIHEIADDIIDTWKGKRVLMHVSEQGDGKIGHHSDYIEEIPHDLFNMLEDKEGLVVDLEVEAKMKEKAIMKLYQKYPDIFDFQK